jgi:hypothetical protein
MVNYTCEICGKVSTQKSHHDAHLKSKEHKLKCENFRMKLVGSKSLKEILEEYPQFKSEVEGISDKDFLLDGENEQDNIDAVKNAEKNLKYEIAKKVIKIKANNKSGNKKTYKTGSVLELIQNLIKNENNFENILESINYEDLDEDGNGIADRSTRGFFYERLWDLCIKLGLTDLTDDKSSHVFGNANKDTINYRDKPWSSYSFLKYLNEPVSSGNSGGYSDITFLNKKTDYEELYFISVKYFEKEKKIDSYDVSKLCVLQEKHKDPKRNVHIYLFVKNKKKAIANFERQNISSNVLIKFVNPRGKYENIYDSSDLHKYYFKLRQLFEQYNYFETQGDIDKFEEYYLGDIKPPFIPRFHQKLFIDKINHLIIHEKELGVLVGAIPRSGKSYIMAGSILEYVKEYEASNSKGDKLNFLMITPAPNETFSEYTDIFEKHIDFKNNNINCKIFRGKITVDDLNKDKHNVIIISKQKLGWSEPGKEGDEKVELIKKKINDMFKEIKNKIELMYLDEAHFGMSTAKSMEILKLLDNFGKKIPKIYVTATYNKPLKIYRIKEHCKLTWDVNDINIMKNLNESSINDNPIKDRFGKEFYENALEWRGDKTGKDILKNLTDTYSIYPKPHLITSLWHRDKLQIEKGKIKNTNYGFDMAKLFMTKNGSFENKEQIYEILRYYFGKPEKNMDYNDQDFYKKKGIVPRIKNMCSGKSRTMQEKHMTSQLWFLPVGSNGLINDKITALLEVLLNPEFKKLDYHYFTYVDGKKGLDPSGYITYMENPNTIKSEIEQLEDNIRKVKNGVKGRNLIILTGNRLQLGISLRNVDIVVMWNSVESTDAIFQMLFRSMTEVDITECDDSGFCPKKKWGFMVDLNPQRSMTNVNLFSENINYAKQGSDKSKEYRQIIDLIDIDGDIINEVDNQDEIVNDLFNRLYEAWDRDVDSIKKITENFSYSPAFITQIENQLRMIKFTEKTKKILIQEPEDKMESGDKKENISQKDREKVEKEVKEVKEIPIDKLAAELVAELISLLNIFTLYLDGNSKCVLLNEYKKNQNVVIMSDISKLKDSIFNNQNQKSIFLNILNGRLGGDEKEPYSDFVVDYIIKSISDTKDISHMEKIIFSQKKQYYGIKDPDKLLEDINNNLAPKDKERKEKGEVFTPISIVRDMLDKLPSEVWTNPYLKWLDPAVGIGNFPVIVYLKLMEGLKHFKDEKIDLTGEENRRRHILENMLYMVEISEKSIFILNKVLCGKEGGGQYKLNIYDKSFIEKEYKPDIIFDIIMGNPPYNPPKGESGKSSGNSIWQNFVMKSFYMLSEKGYLVFVHPPGWKKPTLDIYREYLLLQTNDYTKQIRQGQVWQVLKNYGAFNYIYSNDQKSKHVEYINYFPAVDYYVYQKNGDKSYCNTKSIFNGKIYESTNVKLNYDLDYLPMLITNETQNILNNIVNKNDNKLNIKADRKLAFGKNLFDNNKLEYKYLYSTKKGGIPIYAYSDTKLDNVDKNKIIFNLFGGIDGYYIEYISSGRNLGSAHQSGFMIVDNKNIGENIVKTFSSNILKFIFLITQYSSGMRTQNESIVANSISIPPTDFKGDLYEFYDIHGYQKYIEDLLNDYEESIKPKPKKVKTFDFDGFINELKIKILSLQLENYKSPNGQMNLYEFAMKELNSEIEHLKTLSETVLKRHTKSKYLDQFKKEKAKHVREITLKLKEEKRKIKEEKKEKTKTIKKNTKTPTNKDEGFKQPVETDHKYIQKYQECLEKDGYLWNIHTKRCVKDTKENRKKLTLKKN